MARINKIRRKIDFNRIFRLGKTIHGGFLTARFLPSQKEAGVAVVVSAKISKKATARNKIRRRVAESLRKHMELFPQKTALVLIAQPKALGAEFRDLDDECLKILNKITN